LQGARPKAELFIRKVLPDKHIWRIAAEKGLETKRKHDSKGGEGGVSVPARLTHPTYSFVLPTG
jgi:hypothetical protein